MGTGTEGHPYPSTVGGECNHLGHDLGRTRNCALNCYRNIYKWMQTNTTGRGGGECPDNCFNAFLFCSGSISGHPGMRLFFFLHGALGQSTDLMHSYDFLMCHGMLNRSKARATHTHPYTLFYLSPRNEVREFSSELAMHSEICRGGGGDGDSS